MASQKPPFNPDVVYQRAAMQHQAGNFVEAEKLYQMLLDYFPKQIEVLSALGTLKLQLGKSGEGIKLLKKSLSLYNYQHYALYSLGVEYQMHQAKLEEALRYYKQAFALNPNDLNTCINLGNTLKDLKRCGEALKAFDQAIAIRPDYASAYWNKALLSILMGEYDQGWQLYEYGWACGERGKPRDFSQPKWLGEEPIACKTLLIHSEQGLGDTLQFCRYALLAEAAGANVILEVQFPLVPLLKTLSERIAVIPKGSELPDFDFYCPVMSLPLAFRTTLENIPNNVPYLHVDETKRKEWATRLGVKTKPRVGLVWSGSMTNPIDNNPCCRRNIPLEQLKSLFSLPIEFHSLQKEYRSEDDTLLSSLNIHLHHDELNDFAETAALVTQMDLVISVCTSVAHLAGAIGHRTWVLLPYSPDYRWMLGRDDSLWYPSVTLFRQDTIGDWSQVTREVEKGLKRVFDKS
jgi:Tfp pilus assembly protein PilF